MNAPLLTRAAVAILGAWTVLCLGVLLWHAVRNPMHARAQALESRLAGMVSFADPLPEPDTAPQHQLRTRIVGKSALWKELVPAPPAAAKPQADPNLKEKLKGVTATRHQIASKDGVTVKLFLGPQDKRGSWKKVGDAVNGLTIREITPEAVVFSIKQGGKEYTVELPRR